MTFSAPLGLLALLAVPAVLVMHLFRRRLRQRRVAGLFLWSEQRLAADAGRKRARLLHSKSLWLEMLAAAAAALWLAGPIVGGGSSTHLVALLDDRASLAAVAADGRSVRDRLADELRRRVAELSASDRLTVLRTGPRPEVLLGPAAPPAELEAALSQWRPARPAHDPLPALDFARELAGRGGEVVWFTDRPQPAAGAAVTVVARGAPQPNAALGSAQRYALDDGEQLRVQVLGFGGIGRAVLTVYAGDTALLRRELELGADGRAQVVAPLPAGTGELRLQLADDALAIDNEALLLPPAPRTVAVCDLLPDDVRQALRLRRALAVQRDWRAEVDPARAQLVLATQPGRLRPGQLEVVFQPGEGDDERQAWPGPFVVDRGDELMQGVRLDGVVWVSGPLQPPGRVLAAAGDEVLCAVEELDAGDRVWLDLDPFAGNLARAPDWPILLANLLDRARREVPGAEQQHVLLGDEARYRRSLRAGAPDRELALVAPDGSRQPGRGLRTVGWLPERVGRHSVRDADDREIAAFAARFLDPATSDLSGAADDTAAATEDAGPASGAGREGDFERRWLGLLLCLFVLADWWVLQRGRA